MKHAQQIPLVLNRIVHSQPLHLASALLFGWLIAFSANAVTTSSPNSADAIEQARTLRNSGDLLKSIEQLQTLATSSDTQVQAAARAELGESLMAAGRLDEAQPLLQAALEASAETDRARYQLLMASIAVRRKQETAALNLLNDVLANTHAAKETTLASPT